MEFNNIVYSKDDLIKMINYYNQHHIKLPQLNNDIYKEIILRCHIKMFKNLSLINKLFYHIINNKELWKEQLKLYNFPLINLDPVKNIRHWREQYSLLNEYKSLVNKLLNYMIKNNFCKFNSNIDPFSTPWLPKELIFSSNYLNLVVYNISSDKYWMDITYGRLPSPVKLTKNEFIHQIILLFYYHKHVLLTFVDKCLDIKYLKKL